MRTLSAPNCLLYSAPRSTEKLDSSSGSRRQHTRDTPCCRMKRVHSRMLFSDEPGARAPYAVCSPVRAGPKWKSELICNTHAFPFSLISSRSRRLLGSSFPRSAEEDHGAFHTDATVPNAWEMSRIVKCGDLGSCYTYAVRRSGATNLYLWSGNGSAASGLLDAQVHFRVIRLTDGAFALQTVDGSHYLTADDGGGLEGGTVFLTTETHIQTWEKFNIADQGDGTYTIQTVRGFFVGMGDNGAITTRITNPNSPPPGPPLGSS